MIAALHYNLHDSTWLQCYSMILALHYYCRTSHNIITWLLHDSNYYITLLFHDCCISLLLHDCCIIYCMIVSSHDWCITLLLHNYYCITLLHDCCITLLLYDCFITLSNDGCIILSLHDCCIMLLLYDCCSTWLLPYNIHNDSLTKAFLHSEQTKQSSCQCLPRTSTSFMPGPILLPQFWQLLAKFLS